MAGLTNGGTMQTIGTILNPRVMGQLLEQKEHTQQKSAIDQLIGSQNFLDKQPMAMQGISQLKGSPALPDFTPSAPVPQTSRLPVPAFGDNKGVAGNFAAQDLPGAQQSFQTGLLAKAFPTQMATSILSQLTATPKDEVVGPGASIFRTKPGGLPTLVGTAPDKPPEGFKVGATREVQIGDQKHTQEYQGNNVWKDIGSGAAFAPQQEPAPVEIDDPTSPTGRRLVARAQGINQPGPAQQSPQATANTLRDEFNKQTEQVRTVASMYRNGVKGAAAQSGAGDMNLIYSFMKALDPGSSVKEGEYAQGENLTGAYGKFWQSYNKAKDGEKLLPEVRTDILGQLKNIYQSHLPSFAATKQRYSDIATRQRVKPEDVVSDLPAIEEPTKTPQPPPGGTMLPDGRVKMPDGKILKWVP